MIAFFDSFPRHTYTREKLDSLGVPAADAEYMAAFGLPVLDDYWFDNVSFFEESLIRRTDLADNMVVIGSLYESHGVALSSAGVYIIDNGLDENSQETDCCRVNSSLEMFLRFMAIYCEYIEKYGERLDEGDEDLAERVSAELEQKFRELDEVALEDENSLWSVLAEEIGYN